jgi:hypothetical protein
LTATWCGNQEFRTPKSPLIEKGFSGAKYKGRNAPMIHAYAQVSTDGQSIDAQVKAVARRTSEGRARRGKRRHARQETDAYTSPAARAPTM